MTTKIPKSWEVETDQTYDDDGRLDYDRVTQTVRSDDGSRLTIWDIDDCPLCGASLHRCYGTDDGKDRMFCLNSLGFEATCRFNAERDAVSFSVIERPTSPVRAGGEGGGT